MPPLLEATPEPAASSEQHRAPGELKQPSGRRPRPDAAAATSLHISKLRGISGQVRRRLKRQGITSTDQLLEAAGRRTRRWQLATRSGIDAALLGRLVCRADLIRIKGIGAIFADMLELLGVDRTERLAHQEPDGLHRTLFELNAAERFARRAPTPEEVRHWIRQARALPRLVEDDA